jgi:hypothetical protein
MRNHFLRNNLLLIITLFFTFSCAHSQKSEHSTSAETTVLPDYIFAPTANVTNQIEHTLIAAKTHNKQALFVLGAQWCHDSKSLAKRFSTPQMQKILNDNYQVLFIDVGYLEKGFDVVNQFGLPVYYGTPTVMVVAPNTSKIVNRSSMQKWLNANKVPLNEYVAYFEKFALNKNELASVSLPMQTYLTEINSFEQKQALRIKDGYAILGPLLKQYMESEDKKASSEFSDKWEQVSDLRYRLQNDIQALITQAKNNIATGKSATLTLPVYPAFSWE